HSTAAGIRPRATVRCRSPGHSACPRAGDCHGAGNAGIGGTSADCRAGDSGPSLSLRARGGDFVPAQEQVQCRFHHRHLLFGCQQRFIEGDLRPEGEGLEQRVNL
nr:hypothetical protein [Tanacetum cinerariifolium]